MIWGVGFYCTVLFFFYEDFKCEKNEMSMRGLAVVCTEMMVLKSEYYLRSESYIDIFGRTK